MIVGVVRAAPVRDTCCTVQSYRWRTLVLRGRLRARPPYWFQQQCDRQQGHESEIARRSLPPNKAPCIGGFQVPHFTGRRRVSALRCERITWSSRCRNATGLQVKRILSTYHARSGRKGGGKYKGSPAFARAPGATRSPVMATCSPPGRYVGAPQSAHQDP